MTDQSTDMMAKMAPGAQHERLKSFEGKFKAKVRLWMGPGDPMESTGTMVNSMDLDGRYLRQDYKGDPSEGPFPNFVGHGYWGFNNITERFEGFWIDNASTMMQVEQGSVDAAGRVWTMKGEMADPSTGGTMKKRTVITLQDDDHHKMEAYFDQGGNEFKTMEIEYERAR